MAQALAADQVKIAVIAGPAVVSANLGGLELRIVAGLVNTSHFTLFVRPSIASVYELKGKNWGWAVLEDPPISSSAIFYGNMGWIRIRMSRSSN